MRVLLLSLLPLVALLLLSVNASPWFRGARSASGSGHRVRRDHHDSHEHEGSQECHHEDDVHCFFLEMGKCLCDGPTYCDYIDELLPTFASCNGTTENLPKESPDTTDCSKPPKIVKDAMECLALLNKPFEDCYQAITGQV
ncbi:uncharacterized protein [Panulirus ornatus]|uniref:uncharacterized protein isoform X2 n=1 Tax=Panulirus ornatus TaxID=150431 RepID=UPI003A89C923